MWFLSLKALRNPKVWGLTGAGILVILLLFVVQQHQALEQMQAVYDHPKIVETIQYVKLDGPVHVVYREKILPSGERTIERTTDRGSKMLVHGTSKIEEPVAVSEIMAPHRTNRFLLSIGTNDQNLSTENKLVGIGYSWNNRLDLQFMLTNSDREKRTWVVPTFRF